jgi:hypothetical protein
MSHLNYTLQQLNDLTTQVGDLAVSVGTDKHDLALSALLSAYTTVAMAHPCCLQECANQAFRLSMLLAAHAPNANPSGQVH